MNQSHYKTKKVVVQEEQGLQYTVTSSGNVQHNDAPEYVCSHVETDTRLVYYLSVTPEQNIVVRATDTDIMVILLYHARQFKATVWTELGLSSDNTSISTSLCWQITLVQLVLRHYQVTIH